MAILSGLQEKLAARKSRKGLEKIEKRYAEKLAGEEFARNLGLSDEAIPGPYRMKEQRKGLYQKHLAEIRLKSAIGKVRRYREL